MEANAASPSEIQECFNGKSVFITGGTGFIGKAVIEKLLWSCPDVESIFVLIRGKRGSDANVRLSNLLIEPIFDPVRELLPQAFAKVVAIEGDITLPLLGISSDNLSLLRKTVSVVIHSAATVKFDEPLNVAMNINLGGTSKVLELAQSMELIKAVVYVSTAFSNCERSFIEEKIYPVRIDPVTAIAMYQKCDEDFLEAIKPVLVGDKPNTYVLTKHLAEELVNQWKMAVPVCVVRPSIVIAAYKHPIPGYVDNFNAMSGLLAGVMTGVVRTLLLNDQYVLDVVPVDYVANLIIAAASRLSKTSERAELKIYNLSSCGNPVVLSENLKYVLAATYINPLSRTFWFPDLHLTSSPSLFFVLNVLYHRLPAHVGDSLLWFAGRKRMFISNYHKLGTKFAALRYFCTNAWKFSCENTTELSQSLPPCDQADFPFDISKINWGQHSTQYVEGMRKYAFKDKSSGEGAETTLCKLRRKHQFVKYLVLAPLFMGMCAVMIALVLY